jgi:anaerobic ribonucleoside-triphosphate reductase
MFISKTTIRRTFSVRKKDCRTEKMEYQIQRKILDTCFKKIDKESAKALGINFTKLRTGAIIGTAILYNVKEYKSEADFEKDKNKHYGDIKNLVRTGMDLW